MTLAALFPRAADRHRIKAGGLLGAANRRDFAYVEQNSEDV